MVREAIRENEVLECVRTNPGCTPTEISEALGMRVQNTSMYLKELRKKGLVKFKFDGNALNRKYYDN